MTQRWTKLDSLAALWLLLFFGLAFIGALTIIRWVAQWL